MWKANCHYQLLGRIAGHGMEIQYVVAPYMQELVLSGKQYWNKIIIIHILNLIHFSCTTPFPLGWQFEQLNLYYLNIFS